LAYGAETNPSPMNSILPSLTSSNFLAERSEKLSSADTQFTIHTIQNSLHELSHEMKRLSAYEIFWIKKGAGTLTVNFEKYRLSQNTLCILRPSQYRKLDYALELEGYHITVTPDLFYTTGLELNISFLAGQYRGVNDPILMNFDSSLDSEMEDTLLKLERECNVSLSLRFDIIKELFKVFLLYLSRSVVSEAANEPHSKSAELMNRFLVLLSAHFLKQKNVAFYAGALFVTPNYLNQVVKKMSGVTASYCIQQFIVLEAKRQAIQSSRSMKEIAYDLGFEDTAHFSKFFKKSSGIKFSLFKRQIAYTL